MKIALVFVTMALVFVTVGCRPHEGAGPRPFISVAGYYSVLEIGRAHV